MREELLILFSVSLASLLVMGITIKHVCDFVLGWVAKNRGSASSAMIYVEFNSSNKWFYASYISSTIINLYVFGATVYGWRECDLPEEYQSPPGQFLGNTILTNTYCRLTMTDSMIRLNTFFVAAMWYDIIY